MKSVCNCASLQSFCFLLQPSIQRSTSTMKATTRDIWESIKFALSIDTTVTEKDKKRAQKREGNKEKRREKTKKEQMGRRKNTKLVLLSIVYTIGKAIRRGPLFPPVDALPSSISTPVFFLIFSLTVRNDEKTSTRDQNRSSARIVISAIMSDANAPAAAHNHKMREKRNLMMMALRGWLYGFR